MKILILGGTGFVGRILTENLISAGKAPVLFNRGKRNPGIFPSLRKMTGDRMTDDINQIADEVWDAVVDFSGQQPDNVDHVTDLLKGKAGRYIFVSSVSAYVMDNDEDLKKPITEDFKTYPCTDEQRKSSDILSNYSQKKAECERVILGKDWLDAIIFRPALIYGRYDPTDRFYYWLHKVYIGNEFLIPDEGNTRLNNTYSEDFAKLIEMSISIDKHNKVYNAVTHDPVSINELILIAGRKLNKEPNTLSAEGKFFTDRGVQPWGDIPMWLGGADMMLDNSKVKKDFGIKFGSFEDSIDGCIKYYSSIGWAEPNYGMKPEKELELIAELKKQ
jgi:2'-hydroxyisoflavone reductase